MGRAHEHTMSHIVTFWLIYRNTVKGGQKCRFTALTLNTFEHLPRYLCFCCQPPSADNKISNKWNNNLSLSGDWAKKWVLLVVGWGGDRTSSDHCQGSKPNPNPTMSWKLMQGCVLSLPICWDGSRFPVTLKGTKWSGMKNWQKIHSCHQCSCSNLNDCDFIRFILSIL